MVFVLLLFGFLLFASPGHADFRMATGSGRIPIKMMEMSSAESPKAAPNNLRVGITVDRFSAVDMKRSTVNASDMNIYARHTHMSTHAQLGKRVDCDPTMSEQECRRPPLFPMPACFWCPKAAVLDDPFALLATFTTDEFKRRTRANPATDLRDTCVFYSRTVIAGGPSALSRVATQLACQYGKYSIWHLWPNRKNEQNNNRLLNFYGIFSPDNRLYSISKMGVIPGTSPPKDYFRVYFENMSEAMAQMCTGQIYLLTQTPQNLAQYGVPPLAQTFGLERNCRR
ncbi:hypothetical protein G7054_g5454 [Neopestalotiopsis clavispora]|nr:hypothetical protein G7054_g5454 [Neopestalotiopsis clavispora]